jgi:minor extracellular serine protease Vpr
MQRRVVRISLNFAIPALLAFTMVASGLPSQPGQSHRRAQGPAPMQSLLRRALPGTTDLQLIIELADPPVVKAMLAAPPAGNGMAAARRGPHGRINLESSQATNYRAQLARAQALVMNRLRTLNGIEIQGSTDTVTNTIIARVPVSQYFAVRRLPGVKKVYFSRPQRMKLNTSAELLNAQASWTRAGGRGNAGQGERIGLIDSGIDITNPMFVDDTTALPAGFPKGESAFTNHKVIVARNYISLLSNPQRVHTAIDEDGHGTFVAGCAAGKLVDAPLAAISGMAPGAFLGSYKVFGTPGINDTTTTAAILAAINNAVADGMDVLNLSLGALDYVPPSEDPEVAAINNAIAAGVMVILAAGNEGPYTHTIDTPGSAPEAIAVGAVSNSRIFAAQLHVTGPGTVPTSLQSVAYVPGTGPDIPAPIPSTQVVDVQKLDGSGLSCSALPADSLNGKIAFIARGTCTFAVKVANAASAGAIAVIVYNNVAGDEAIIMAGLESSSIPAVMVSNADGLNLKSFLAANLNATVRFDPSTVVVATPTTPDVVASFSSLGPSADFGLKPDLVAIGTNIYSAAQDNNPAGLLYDPTRFTTADGTSFSTAMTSGAVAVMRQLFPALTPQGVKSVLVNTANQQVTTDGSNPATVLQIGGGLLNMGSASVAGAIFTPASLSFGAHAYSGSITLTKTLVITNTSATGSQYSLSVRPVVSGATVSLQTTTTGLVPPGGSASVGVTIKATAPATRGFQGYITVQSVQSSATYAIPYWAGLYIPDSSRVLTVTQNAGAGGVYGSLSDALAAARPGNVIEIADSQTYDVGGSGLIISTNAEGLPLHGITIRAAQGQTPVLDGTTTAAFANLEIVGVQNVLLQGLTINGGETGIDLLQPSPSVPLSVTIDHCSIINQNASTTSSGMWVENGGDVDVTFSTVSGSASTGMFVAGGTQLTIFNSTIRNNGSDGLDAADSNVEFIDTSVETNTGAGVFLANCSGTITGSTFSGSSGVFGDGLQIMDGTVTVKASTFESNSGAGVALFASSFAGPGPSAILAGNTMGSNGYGVLIDQGQNLRLDGNRMQDNAQGLQISGTTSSLLTNNLIVRSTDPFAGDGITVMDSSTTRAVNNTLYGNQHKGVARSGSASVSIANCIISGNTQGDLDGLAAGDVVFSLVSDGTLTPANGNISGDPKLAAPDAGDFSLSATSPAIDAGSNSVTGIPFLDYHQQLRVASQGSLPGDGRTDMGAVESGSAYPLAYPLFVNGDNGTLGVNLTTGIAVLNPSADSSATAQFTGYSPVGTLLAGQSNPAARLLVPEAQLPIIGFQLFGFPFEAPEVGAVLASSSQKLAGFFLVLDQAFSRMADGADVGSETDANLYFMRHVNDVSSRTFYSVFNPGANPANITATLLDESGGRVGIPQSSVIAPKGQFSFAFDTVTIPNGYVRVSSDRPVTGLEIYGNTSEIAALKAVPAGSQARLLFPHIALNQGYSSYLGILNTSSFPATLRMTAYGNDGNELGNPATRYLDGDAQMLEPAASLFGLASGSMVTGYVIVESDQPGIAGFCEFDYDSGVVHSVATVPATSVPSKKLLFSHVAHQVPAGSGGNYQTGIALLNPFGTPISYRMRVFDGAGAQVADSTFSLGPHAKVAKLLSHPVSGAGFFTQAISLGNGHVEVTSDYPLVGFELFFTEQLTQLASVAAQTEN